MWLRLLVPLTLLWPILAVTAEGTPLRRYRASPARELLALLFCVIAYFVVWVILDKLIQTASDVPLAAITASTVLSLLAVPLLLYAGYKVFGVKPDRAPAEQAP